MVEDKDRTPVAQTIVTKCIRCKMELNHVVIVHDLKGIVARVKCNTCGCKHKYRPDKKAVAKKKTPKKRATKKKKLEPAEIFGKLAEKFKDKKPLSYSMSESFNEEDVIDHKTFGEGFITGTPTSHRITVAFIDGTRTLAQNTEIPANPVS